MREPLSVARIVGAAVEVADRDGLAAVSMRSVARELGVEAMSLYHHVAGKDSLLDALADRVYEQVELPEAASGWREGTEARAHSLRSVLAAHPWALGMVDTRTTPGPAVLRYYDATVGHLRGAGLSAVLASRAFSAVDSYVFGFVLTEQNLPFDAASGAGEFAVGMEPALAEYPHLGALVRDLIAGGYQFSDEFEHGLALVLDSVAARVAAGE
ncbi:TetR/AcrR family transcriptional regulator C-terminal domain-containing protein [Georgenia sp. Z1344]|uniref:TetR/AcrR family transcriptional regulator C-terminal domain-containing protein n=1 Tax=Georgenia sp. Z1344 TaxID=3416706 RepID=UPI003CEC1E0B